MRRFVRPVLLLAAASLAAISPCAAGTAEMLADIYRGSSGSGPIGVREPLVSLGERVVFEAVEPSSGAELWTSDGTPLGTRLLRDLAPGSESTDFRPLGTVGRTAVFLRDLDFGIGPFDLWRSDGTAAGTSLLYDQMPLDGCSFQEMPEAVTVGNRLFFLARTDTVECGLWTTDGTAAGTRLVQDVENEGHDLVAVGSRVFFATADGGLWVSSGTGAVRVKSFAGSFGDEVPWRLTAVGNRIAFLAHESADSGEELWVSDGTGAGTRAVTQFFDPLPFGAQPLLKAIGNVLYFTADDGTGVDLWQSDGGAPGASARRVTDFLARQPFMEPFGADELVRLGGRLVFPAREGSEFRQRLWTSDGTPGGTRVLDGCPAGCPALFPTSFAQLGSRIVFVGYDSRDQPGPWVTDGTAAGTRRLADTAVSFVPVPLLGRAFFVGVGAGGYALWKTDGTPAGTLRLADLGSFPFGGGFDARFAPVAAGGRIFFAASPEQSDSPQLWVSDGSAAGTRVVSDLKTSLSSAPGPFAPFAGGALFGAEDGNARRSLWRSDGTAAGTFRVRAGLEPLSIVTPSAPAPGGVAFVLSRRDRFSGPFEVWRTDGTAAGTSRIEPTGGGQVIDVLASFGDGAVFAVVREDNRLSLWQSDGSPAGSAGTHALLTLPAEVVNVRFLQAVGSGLYFISTSVEGREDLWVSDGTAAGTHPVATERELEFLAAPVFVPVGGAVYFADRFGLWKTDGTASGTAEVWSSEWEENRPTDLTEFNGALYFMAGLPDTYAVRGLWRTDGTPAGTVLVRPVAIPAERYVTTDPVRMVRLGDRLVFLADDGEHGVELWASDGTAAGTAMVRDIAPGAASSPLPGESLVLAGGKVYFPATDGESGFELWESGGGPPGSAGTRRVQDIAPGALSSSPDRLTVSGSRLFFAADDGVHGEEPWVLPLPPLDGGGCVPSDTALCLGGRFRVEADWRDFQGQGNRGRGHAVALTGDTGTFWFFDAANVEVILKVLDGRGINGHHWVFYGALSNVEYTLTVTDTQSGAVRRYFNPRGWLGSLADTEAFGPRGASVAGVVSEGPVAQRTETPAALRSAAVPGNCVPGAEQLCLQGNRFAVKVSWKRSNGAAGAGKAVPLAGGDTGTFWFFDAGNVELVVKVIDGRPLNGKLWVFFGALSDVEYTLTVTDTQTGAMKTYRNPAGRLASVADTGAF